MSEQRGYVAGVAERLPRRLMPSDTLTIGQVSQLAGVNAKTIRYYESIGLLPCPPRGANSYRRYSVADVNRLLLLQRIRLLGVPLSEAKSLLIGATDARCADVQEALLVLVQNRLHALDREIAEIHLLRQKLEGYQHSLETCHPDERETFSACRDMRCIADSGDASLCEENSDGTAVRDV